MALTLAQKALIQRARTAGSGELSSSLSDGACVYLIGAIARDLGLLSHFPEITAEFSEFFAEKDPHKLEIAGSDFYMLIARLLELEPDADTYFLCLATLQKSRLKYSRILEYQPVPTLDQVGPRALLQYGQMTTEALVGFLLWRKWIFDIDNRAGQETGYLFEPIIASAIGGVSYSASRSPIKRPGDRTKGRQVDCIREHRAYEIKIRVTIAASGQGRWREELEFPKDCRESDYTPVLIVLDPTPNPKLSELVSAFKEVDGETYVGSAAWDHLKNAAGPVMGQFLEKYVRSPLSELLESQTAALPEITLSMTEDRFCLTVAGEATVYRRSISGR